MGLCETTRRSSMQGSWSEWIALSSRYLLKNGLPAGG
jgi:hypothetical protein